MTTSNEMLEMETPPRTLAQLNRYSHGVPTPARGVEHRRRYMQGRQLLSQESRVYAPSW